MKIVLCSLYDVGASLGIKSIYLSLRQAGHAVKLLFYDTPRFSKLETDPFLEEINFPTEIPPIIEKDIALFKEIITSEDPEMIGFSLLSSHYEAAKRLTQEVRKVSNAIIVWGGVHAIIDPESCIPYADYVCIGEGEEAIVELVAAIEVKDFKHSIRGIWRKDSDERARSQERVLIDNIDSLTIKPIDIKDILFVPRNRPQIIWNQEIEKKTPYYSANYITMTSRGCPIGCTFCINGCLQEKLNQKKGVRQRSVRHVIDEVMLIKRSRIVQQIIFMDDFFPVNMRWLQAFAKEYAEKIRVPFFCNFYPGQVNNDSVDLMTRAGLMYANMGIQSGSRRIRKDIFGRRESNKKIVNCANILNSRINMRYELICDNPFETEDDVRETLDLFLQFPLPFSLMIFSLTYFPNYPITDMAVKKGYIKEEMIYHELNKDFTRERKNTDPIITSLYMLIMATTKKEFKRSDIYTWSRDKALIENPLKLSKHLVNYLKNSRCN
jgi:anaerobic magnesium-protoporphyrin IX monomethyl ester cyclase